MLARHRGHSCLALRASLMQWRQALWPAGDVLRVSQKPRRQISVFSSSWKLSAEPEPRLTTRQSHGPSMLAKGLATDAAQRGCHASVSRVHGRLPPAAGALSDEDCRFEDVATVARGSAPAALRAVLCEPARQHSVSYTGPGIDCSKAAASGACRQRSDLELSCHFPATSSCLCGPTKTRPSALPHMPGASSGWQPVLGTSHVPRTAVLSHSCPTSGRSRKLQAVQGLMSQHGLFEGSQNL